MGSDNQKSIRRFGYSFRGIAPVHHRFLVRGKRISAIAAICSDGLLGVELVMDSVNGDKFADFVRGTLIPNMHPYDGTSSKCTSDTRQLFCASCTRGINAIGGCWNTCIVPPPYSSDLNLIEKTFSSIKYFLQDHDELLHASKRQSQECTSSSF